MLREGAMESQSVLPITSEIPTHSRLVEKVRDVAHLGQLLQKLIKAPDVDGWEWEAGMLGHARTLV